MIFDQYDESGRWITGHRGDRRIDLPGKVTVHPGSTGPWDHLAEHGLYVRDETVAPPDFNGLTHDLATTFKIEDDKSVPVHVVVEVPAQERMERLQSRKDRLAVTVSRELKLRVSRLMDRDDLVDLLAAEAVDPASDPERSRDLASYHAASALLREAATALTARVRAGGAPELRNLDVRRAPEWPTPRVLARAIVNP